MMRWKPSVSSRSSCAPVAGFSFTAASAMFSLPLFSSLPSLTRQSPLPLSLPRLGGWRGGMDARVTPAHDDFPSVQIISVLRHMLCQTERVIAHKVFGALGVARLQRFDDVHVIADRAVDAILLADGLAADH